MSSAREQMPPRRNRQHPASQHTEADLPLDEAQPSKRLQSSNTEFYDSLSKVWLTRRALEELDRRTRQAGTLQQPASEPRQAYQQDISEHLRRYARHGGPELHDLRGYLTTREMAFQSQSTLPEIPSTLQTIPSSKPKKCSAYDNNFEQHYIDNHIHPKGYKHCHGRQTPGSGLEGLHQRLLQPRLSLSLSHFPISDFQAFQDMHDELTSEAKVMRTVFPIISGSSDIPTEQDLFFTRLEPMTNKITVNPKPDFYDGARLQDIDKEVRKELGSFIIPTNHETALVAPNFFVEVKAPTGFTDIAERQAMQDGAYGARAMHSLQSYSKGKAVYDSNAYTITLTYHAGNGTLQIYTTHPTRGEDGISPEYHMNQGNAWALTGNIDSFRQGVTAFRNARDWAQEQRDTFITAANQRARSRTTEPSRTNQSTYSDWLATLNKDSEPQHPQNPSNVGIGKWERLTPTVCEEAPLSPHSRPQFAEMSWSTVHGNSEMESFGSAV